MGCRQFTYGVTADTPYVNFRHPIGEAHMGCPTRHRPIGSSAAGCRGRFRGGEVSRLRPKSTFVFSALRKSAGGESGGDTAKTQLYIRFLHLFLRVGLSEAQKSPSVWFSPRGVFQPPKAQKVRPGGEKGGEKRKSQLYIRFLLRFLLLWATS